MGIAKEEPCESRDDYLEAVSPERSLPADETYSDAEQEEEGEEDEEEQEEEEDTRTEGSVVEEEEEDEEEDEGEDEELEEGMGGLLRTGYSAFPNGHPAKYSRGCWWTRTGMIS